MFSNFHYTYFLSCLLSPVFIRTQISSVTRPCCSSVRMVYSADSSCWFWRTMTPNWTCGPGGVSPSTVTASSLVRPPAAHTATHWSATSASVMCPHRPAQTGCPHPSLQTSSTAATMRWILPASATPPKPNSTHSAPSSPSRNGVKKIWSWATSRGSKVESQFLPPPKPLLHLPPSANLLSPF